MHNQHISIAAVFGTRPEAVKLLPVIRRIRADARLHLRVVVTGQHREMLREILEPFGVVPDVDLDIMQPGQTLNDIVCRAMPRLDELYASSRPDWVVVQGDTTSAFCAALAAFDRRIPVAHVEAGLRSFDRRHPYPEEANRRMLTAVTDLHFAPTRWAAQNLLSEGVPREQVAVTGNTVIDALFLTLGGEIGRRREIPPTDGGRRTVLITMHRREAWETPVTGRGSVLDGVLRAVRKAADRHPDVDFVYPVHLNPKVQEAAKRAFAGAENARLIEPLPYVRFVKTMAKASVIVTDSGGVQEEAPSLGIPVLVLRRTTERPEALETGANRLVGTDPDDIEEALAHALQRTRETRALTLPRPNPFGDGRASDRIVRTILHLAGHGEAPEPFELLGDEDDVSRSFARGAGAAGPFANIRSH
jgi:UDP-N-acetylglucosamine 2-epimerase (non-hydrolysing)